MLRVKFTYLYILFLVIGVTIRQAAFIVWEGEQALITQFGEIVRDPITEAGLHFKIPFIQLAQFQDKRLLNWEGSAEQVPTGDQRYISVKSAALWRIGDLSQFIQTVQTIPVARARLDSIVNGAIRDVISANDLMEVVRLNNDLFQHPWVTDDVKRENDARAVIQDQRDLYTVLAKVSEGRSVLEKRALVRAHREAKKLGITIATLNIKQLSYQEAVEKTVHERMISERIRVAEKIRAIGRGEEARIRGKLASDYQTIIAPAQRKAEVLKGQADGEAIKIYGEALMADPKLYSFLRTMDAYRKGLTKNGELILSSNSSFFNGMSADFGR